ncbi:MAG: fructose-bisphosphatase class II, partial [Actinobacteria bacterium]|nr:fructose-bisphosphatase class II [Actinomycetota bacterium]
MTSTDTATLFLHPDRNLAMELVRATEAAAIRATPWIGRGDKNAADGAAVDAMRKFLGTVNFDGLIVIGEGEKDNAPMLFNGEHVGNGRGPACDIAVDPIDGTSLTAAGRQNALSVIAVSDRGTMLDASSVFYMDKIVVPPRAKDVIDLDDPPEHTLVKVARALGKEVSDLHVMIMDKPRHKELIARVLQAGAAVQTPAGGDVG